MIALVALLVSATLQPPAPKVGDLITVTFAGPVTLDASADYEVVHRAGNKVVVRTFAPRPFQMSGAVAGARFTNLNVPVTSVLKPGDDLAPAPLAAPQPSPAQRGPLMAIAIAAVCAAAAWTVLWWRSRRQTSRVMEVVSAVAPDERYRRAVAALRANRTRAPWATLADETRLFLAATRPDLGKDLTTTEVLPRLREQEAIVREILLQGDLEKFSLRGARPRDFDEVAALALELARAQVTTEVAA
jgi:hypothetical protein